VRRLEEGVHVLIGTPARTTDLIRVLRCEALRPNSIRQCVLYDADELLSRGFEDALRDMFRLLPPTTQRILLLTTIPPAAKQFLRDPIQVLEQEREEPYFGGIKQFYVSVDREEWKLDTLWPVSRR
jgi:translation initiation factor 4A